jgi:flagellin
VLSSNNASLSTSLERLSTGLKINRGKDDPAGLIASENLKVEQRGIAAAITNAQRADQVANIADSGMAGISSMLSELQSLVTNTASKAGISEEEQQADQLVVDSILQTVDRVASTTNFQGIKLLNGNYDYKTSSVNAGVSDFRIGTRAKFTGSSLAVDVTVTQSAQQGGLFLFLGAHEPQPQHRLLLHRRGQRRQGQPRVHLHLGHEPGQDEGRHQQLQRRHRRRRLALQQRHSHRPGQLVLGLVRVRLRPRHRLGRHQRRPPTATRATPAASTPASPPTGDSVNTTIASSFAASANAVRDYGQDIGGTINGLTITGKGKTARVSSDFLDAEITLDGAQSPDQWATSAAANASMFVTGGGAGLQLDSKVGIGGQVSMGIQSVEVNKLGNSSVGYLKNAGQRPGEQHRHRQHLQRPEDRRRGDLAGLAGPRPHRHLPEEHHRRRPTAA